jgi:putative membrane protein
MRMKLTAVAVVAAMTVLSVGIGGSASAAAPAAADSTFMHDNAQTNLAEITIGKIAESRAESADTKALAEKTMTDHEAALTKLKAVAKSVGFTLPDAPNAAQQADAAKLTSVSQDQFDLTYAQVQVAGHQLSIAGTKTELATGTSTEVKNYAAGYLPVAQMHLVMAQDLLTTLGGATPTAVPAGSGGAGATTATSTRLLQLALGVLGLMLFGFAASTITRRRRTS